MFTNMEIPLQASGGGNEKIYIATASSNAEVKAWDVVTSFSNPVVTLMLPFAPKYIYTRSKYTNGNNNWVNIWDSDISANNYVLLGETDTPTIGQAASIQSMPATASWIKSVSGTEVQLQMNDSLTLTDALFIAIG